MVVAIEQLSKKFNLRSYTHEEFKTTTGLFLHVVYHKEKKLKLIIKFILTTNLQKNLKV